MSFGDIVKEIGAYATAIVAAIGLFTLVIWKPFTKFLSKTIDNAVDKKLTPAIAEINTRFDSLNGKITNMSEDIAELERDRLTQLYYLYISRGYASQLEKQEYKNWFTRYHNRGWNHLQESNCDEIFSLPDA